MSRWLAAAFPDYAPDSPTNTTNDDLKASDNGSGLQGVGFVGCRVEGEEKNGALSDAPEPNRNQVNGGRLRVVGGVDADDAAALASILDGNRTPGGVATATGIGATRAYQAIDRLLRAGRIGQAPDGTLSAG